MSMCPATPSTASVSILKPSTWLKTMRSSKISFSRSTNSGSNPVGAFTARSGAAPAPSCEREQHLLRRHLLAHFHRELSDGGAARRAHRVLELHRLDDDQRVARRHDAPG